MDIRIRNLLLIIIFVSLLASSFVAYRRLVVEWQDKSVEMAMDYNDIVRLAQMDGIKESALLRSVKDIGVTSIALPEDTLDSLEMRGSLSWVRGSDIFNLFRVTRRLSPAFRSMLNNKAIDPAHYYLGFTNMEIFNKVKEELSLTLERTQVKELDSYLLEVSDDELDLAFLGIGIPQDIYSRLKAQGFKVIPRLKNSFRITPQKIVRKLNLERFAYDDDMIIFDEEEVLGYPYGLKNLAGELSSRGLRFGFIEFSEQLGDKSLARHMKESVIRIHSIPPDEMEIMSKEAALARWMRAVNERGVRLLYVHPFFRPDYGKNLTETNLSYVTDLMKRLNAAGYDLGSAGSQGGLRVNSLEVLLICLGMIAVLLLLADKFVKLPDWAVYICLLSGAVLICSVEYSGRVLLVRKAGAFAAAVAFPSLAIIIPFSIDRLKEGSLTFFGSVSRVFKAFGIAACGALAVVGLLSDTLFRVGAEQFGGVKLALILPVLLVSAYFFLENSFDETAKKFIRLMKEPLSVGHIAFLGAAGAFGILFILRSGNFGIAVPGFERFARDILETLLYARPRTKEFLLGYPIMLLAAFYYHRIPREWLWLPLAVSVIAPISFINTFTHIHSALFISIVRSINGLILGLLVGMILAGMYELAKRAISRYS